MEDKEKKRKRKSSADRLTERQSGRKTELQKRKFVKGEEKKFIYKEKANKSKRKGVREKSMYEERVESVRV